MYPPRVILSGLRGNMAVVGPTGGLSAGEARDVPGTLCNRSRHSLTPLLHAVGAQSVAQGSLCV